MSFQFLKGFKTVQVNNVELLRMGQQTSLGLWICTCTQQNSVILFEIIDVVFFIDLPFSASLNTNSFSLSVNKGNYPLHFHMCGDVDNREKPSLLSGNSIRNSFARCITVHGSHGVQVCIEADIVFKSAFWWNESKNNIRKCEIRYQIQRINQIKIHPLHSIWGTNKYGLLIE